MAQQTAVQMLIEYVKQRGFDFEYEMEMSFLDHEKEQIIKAFSDGQETHINNPAIPHYSNEEYYNDTYNK